MGIARAPVAPREKAADWAQTVKTVQWVLMLIQDPNEREVRAENWWRQKSPVRNDMSTSPCSGANPHWTEEAGELEMQALSPGQSKRWQGCKAESNLPSLWRTDVNARMQAQMKRKSPKLKRWLDQADPSPRVGAPSISNG